MGPESGLERIAARLRAGEAVVAGVLSGTSGDGIDVALVRFGPAATRPDRPAATRPDRPAATRPDSSAATRPGGGVDVGALEPLAFRTSPFPAELAPAVRALLDGRGTAEAAEAAEGGEAGGASGAVELGALARLDAALGRAFGAAARETARAAGLALDLVGSHGLTVFHHDGRGAPATLQLGCGDAAAEAAGCAVASDFRRRDVAAGGEGAPISALADDVVFAHVGRPLAVLNLGGLGNLTVLARDDAHSRSFDTGPANCLLDGLARRLLGAPYDAGGAAAARGTVDRELATELLRHPFLDAPPPRSTGRDTFGEPWIDEVVARFAARRSSGGRGTGAGAPAALDAGLDAVARADLLATAVEVVAVSVGWSLERFVPRPARAGLERLFVAGGGVHHRPLMAALARTCAPLAVRSAAAAGVDPDAREARVFAVLAARCLLGVPATRRWATGAAAGRVLGRLSPPRVDSP